MKAGVLCELSMFAVLVAGLIAYGSAAFLSGDVVSGIVSVSIALFLAFIAVSYAVDNVPDESGDADDDEES